VVEQRGLVAGVLTAGGRPREGIELLRRAVADARALVASAPAQPQWMASLATALAQLGRMEAASGDEPDGRREFEEALRIERGLCAQAPDEASWCRDAKALEASLAPPRRPP